MLSRQLQPKCAAGKFISGQSIRHLGFIWRLCSSICHVQTLLWQLHVMGRHARTGTRGSLRDMDLPCSKHLVNVKVKGDNLSAVADHT